MPVGVFFRARNTEATVGTLHDCRGGIEVDAARTMPLADPPKALLAPGHTPAILHLQTKTKLPKKQATCFPLVKCPTVTNHDGAVA